MDKIFGNNENGLSGGKEGGRKMRIERYRY